MVIDGRGSFKTVQDAQDVSSGDGGSEMQKMEIQLVYRHSNASMVARLGLNSNKPHSLEKATWRWIKKCDSDEKNHKYINKILTVRLPPLQYEK